MPCLFPWRDLIEAHVIRGWLAAQDIEAHVVHENAQIAIPTCAFQVRLAIHEGDFDEISDLLRVAREPLPEDFEIVEAGPVSEVDEAAQEFFCRSCEGKEEGGMDGFMSR